jgi:hypothetical protein
MFAATQIKSNKAIASEVSTYIVSSSTQGAIRLEYASYHESRMWPELQRIKTESLSLGCVIAGRRGSGRQRGSGAIDFVQLYRVP